MGEMIYGKSIDAKLLKALGLPEHVASFELRVAAGEHASVKCEYFPDKEAIDAGITILAQYDLVKREA